MSADFELTAVRGRKTLQDQVYERLRSALMSGEFSPGERLTPREISISVDTSVMPVREAMRRLTSEGALETLPNGGIRVPMLGVKTLKEVTEIRLLIEPLAAKKAARNATPALIEKIRAEQVLIKRAVRSGDPKEESKANRRFHFAIYGAANSIELLRLIENVWLRIGPALFELLCRRNEIDEFSNREYLDHHDALISALERKQGREAAQALKEDLKCGAKVLVGLNAQKHLE